MTRTTSSQTAASASALGQCRAAHDAEARVATPLPPLKPSQTGKRWPEKGADRGDAGRLRQVRPDQAGEQHGRGALGRVEQQGGGGQPLAARPQHIGRADIAGADLAHVAEPGGAGQHQPERDRAERVAEQEAQHRRQENLRRHVHPQSGRA